MEIDWSKAPSWANYRIKTLEGRFIWAEDKPKIVIINGRDGWDGNNIGRWQVQEHEDWRESLQERPK